MRLPYPIPEPERTQLIAAGELAMEAFQRHSWQSHQYRGHHQDVEAVIAAICRRYGIEEEEQPT